MGRIDQALHTLQASRRALSLADACRELEEVARNRRLDDASGALSRVGAELKRALPELDRARAALET